MKKLWLLPVILLICFTLSACRPPDGAFLSRYTVELGRQVFVSTTDVVYSASAIQTLPEGCLSDRPLGNRGYVVYLPQYTQDTDGQQVETSRLYGLASTEGKLLVECKYNLLSISGEFFCFTYNEENNYVNDIYYSDGVKLLSISGIVTLEAISDSYCTLYYDEYSQVFDKNGLYYFGSNNLMNGSFAYSLCDGRLFGHDAALGDWFIWDMDVRTAQDGTPSGYVYLNAFFSSDDIIYTVAYMGNSDFLVIESGKGSTESFDYYDVSDGTKYYFSQQVYIVNINTGAQRTVSLEYPILGVLNRHSPTLSNEQRQNFNVAEGYTAVSVPVLGEDKRRISVRYYVIDSNANFILRYPEGISPSSISFTDGYGFAGEASSNYSAALYYANCDTIWQKTDYEYFAQSFSCGRYVSAHASQNGMVFGITDSDGDVVCDWEYDFISPYSNSLALAIKDEVFYMLDIDGKATTLTDTCYDDTLLSYYGCYGILQDEKLGVRSFDGTLLIPPQYDGISGITMADGALYIYMESTEAKVMYKLTQN